MMIQQRVGSCFVARLIYLMDLKLLNHCILKMRNKKFNLTGYQHFRSTQFRQTSHQSQQGLKMRHSPQKSAFIKIDVSAKTRQMDAERILGNRHRVFSLEKLSYFKKKEQKQLLESARLPSFNIKKLFERTANKKSNQPLRAMSSSCSPSYRRETTAQPALKRYWQRYLNEEITYADLTKQLNKNIVDGTQRQKRNQSEYRCIDVKGQENQSKSQKSAFYINNFIKTTYRKRRFQHKNHLEQQFATKQPIKIEEKPQNRFSNDEMNLKNWSMIPWQKDNDLQQQEIFNQL